MSLKNSNEFFFPIPAESFILDQANSDISIFYHFHGKYHSLFFINRFRGTIKILLLSLHKSRFPSPAIYTGYGFLVWLEYYSHTLL